MKNDFKLLAYVLIAGAAGAVCRYSLHLFNADRYNILIINIAGAFLLAVIFDYFGEMEIFSQDVCGALGTGFIGSFTTFSAFSYENVRLFLAGEYLSAGVYTALTFIGGITACAAGMWLSHMLVRKARRPS